MFSEEWPDNMAVAVVIIVEDLEGVEDASAYVDKNDEVFTEFFFFFCWKYWIAVTFHHSSGFLEEWPDNIAVVIIVKDLEGVEKVPVDKND